MEQTKLPAFKPEEVLKFNDPAGNIEENQWKSC